MKWGLRQDELPLLKREPRSAWIMLPPEIVPAVRKMIKGNVLLGNTYQPGKGITTAANGIFFINRVEKTDNWPDIAFIETIGGREIDKQKARIETDMIKPLVRGRNIKEWGYDVANYIIWTYDKNGKVRDELPRNAQIYFTRKKVEEKLKNRRDFLVAVPMEKGAPPWIIGNVSSRILKDKVAWQKIAKTIEATYLPSEHEDEKLGQKSLIVDSNVHFVPANELSLELTGILNSTPVRVFTAAFVTRTGAVYCAFFVWVVGLIPIPEKVRKGDKKLQRISKRLQKVNGSDKRLLRKLDERVGSLYGLSDNELSAMKDFLDFFTS